MASGVRGTTAPSIVARVGTTIRRVLRPLNRLPAGRSEAAGAATDHALVETGPPARAAAYHAVAQYRHSRAQNQRMLLAQAKRIWATAPNTRAEIWLARARTDEAFAAHHGRLSNFHGQMVEGHLAMQNETGGKTVPSPALDELARQIRTERAAGPGSH
jgi:hypothetical protein